MTITAVVVSRNDNYGYTLNERASYCLNSLCNTFDEVFYIDWNSQNKSLIEELKDNLNMTNKLKYIVINPELANELTEGNNAQGVCEVLARNVGICRATSEWIVSTNIDIILSYRKYFENYKWDKNTFYSISRRDIDINVVRHINVNQPESIAKLLEDLFPSYGPHGRDGAVGGDIWSLICNCGDFQFAHRNIWNTIKGFEQSLKGRSFADSNVQKKAAITGFNLVPIFDLPVFHIAHDKPTTDKFNNAYEALITFKQTTNPDTWGFSDKNFKIEVL